MENKEQAALTSLAWLSNCLWAKNTEQSQNNWLGWALPISNCGLHLRFPRGHLYAQSGMRLKRTKTRSSSFSFSDLSTAEWKLNCEVDFFKVLEVWRSKLFNWISSHCFIAHSCLQDCTVYFQQYHWRTALWPNVPAVSGQCDLDLSQSK